MNEKEPSIPIVASNVVWILAGVAALLVLAHVITQAISFTTGNHGLYGIVRLFFLDSENNIPSFFSTAILLLASLLLGLIGTVRYKTGAPYRKHWIALAFVFLLLAMDEAASIHELLVRPTKELIGPWADKMDYAWVILGILGVIVLGCVYFRFWLDLPPSTRFRVLIAGGLYLGGVLVVEILGGYYAAARGKDTFLYIMFVTIEESLEMAGVIVFLFALLGYLEGTTREVRLRFLTSGEATTP